MEPEIWRCCGVIRKRPARAISRESSRVYTRCALVSSLRDWLFGLSLPSAYALGYILSPRRGSA